MSFSVTSNLMYRFLLSWNNLNVAFGEYGYSPGQLQQSMACSGRFEKISSMLFVGIILGTFIDFIFCMFLFYCEDIVKGDYIQVGIEIICMGILFAE